MTTYQDIRPIGVDEPTPLHTTTQPEIVEPIDPNELDQYKYVNLHGKFGDLSPTEETISQIINWTKQQNFKNTLDFITNEARRDQMINNDYILVKIACRLDSRSLESAARK